MKEVKIKQSVNLWEISYTDNSPPLTTVFNSGFIDDVYLVTNYFLLKNPHIEIDDIKLLNKIKPMEKINSCDCNDREVVWVRHAAKCKSCGFIFEAY